MTSVEWVPVSISSLLGGKKYLEMEKKFDF
jgi:hypothetical protein